MLSFVCAVVVAGAPPTALAKERAAFKTKLTREDRDATPLDTPPAAQFSIVKWKGPLGELRGVVSKPKSAGLHAAIVWLSGGFPAAGVDQGMWSKQDPSNDQSAAQYRAADVIVLYPTTRGTFGNDGVQESFLGEADDVVSAVEFLRTQKNVDPKRVFLGGHSTGATLALLAAESGAAVNGVIALGPATNPCGYGARPLPFDNKDAKECAIRSPAAHLADLTAPTVVVEGELGNSADLEAFKSKATVAMVSGGTHFTIIAPVNAFLASRVAKGPLAVSPAEVQAAFDAAVPKPVVKRGEWSFELPRGFVEDTGAETERTPVIYRWGDSSVGVQLMKSAPACPTEATDKIKPSQEPWRSGKVCVLRVDHGEAGVMLSAIVPLVPEPIVLHVGGPTAAEDASWKLLREVLPTIKGK
ncbi:MAG: alpha/beta fold hydrolase [Archangium sp.]